MSPSRLAGVGAFVLGGILLFAIGLFLIGERRMLFAAKFTIYTEFQQVSGLQAGAPVKVNGMPAGEVEAVIVPQGPGAPFRVRFQVREDLHPLVRTDSVASIQTEGLVGGSFLAVGAGTEGASLVPEQGTIRGREPFDYGTLLVQMSDTVKMVNDTISVLRVDVEKATSEIAETAERANSLTERVGGDVEAITASARRISADTQGIVAGLREGRGTVGRLLNDDEIYQRAAAIARETQAVVEEARRTVAEGRQAIASLRAGNGPAQGLASDLRQTLAHARGALSNLEENTEALKRNWFFRGFFKDRGYFDLDAISPAEYRRGLLEGDGRRALRIWLRAGVLFAAASDGTEVLTDDGRARLDSAMATYLPYPIESPLIVEGYSTVGSEDERHLRGRSLAAMVREHLVSRFYLDTSRIAIMPLGARAEDSPDGDTWDGVALAIFVEREAVARGASHETSPRAPAGRAVAPAEAGVRGAGGSPVQTPTGVK